jgi:hypothetical protein
VDELLSGLRGKLILRVNANIRPEIFVKVALLIIGHALAGLAAGVAGCFVLEYEYADGVFPLVVGLLVSESSLVGTWTALGTTFWLLRWLGAAATVAWLGFLYWMMFRFGSGPSSHMGLDAVVLHGEVFLFVVLGAGVYRLHAGPVRRITPDEQSGGIRFQYSLRHLFAAMLITALVVTGFKLALPVLRSFYSLASYSVLAAGFGLICWASVWVMLAGRRPAIGIPPILTLAAAVGAGQAWLIHRTLSSEKLEHFCSMTCGQAIFLLLSLAVMRRAGYRWGAMAPAHAPN